LYFIPDKNKLNNAAKLTPDFFQETRTVAPLPWKALAFDRQLKQPIVMRFSAFGLVPFGLGSVPVWATEAATSVSFRPGSASPIAPT